ncbi:hypothetical protein J2T57_001652 [Natronocella acetinitrilica]|uniref:Uncharacterized protein n=1 Tax=Natronocella acetinitrilica TaxID=414046 RepID=A0AAE3G2H9_9GAMM|nr:hypothetical protein [Natronocella acetinitrilica]MCP1674550.1 hypothetical protein [Natronocella acetinitrilica]
MNDDQDPGAVRLREDSAQDAQDTQLIANVLRNMPIACPAAPGDTRPFWWRVSRLFAIGSTRTQALCLRFGIDPETGRPREG